MINKKNQALQNSHPMMKVMEKKNNKVQMNLKYVRKKAKKKPKVTRFN